MTTKTHALVIRRESWPLQSTFTIARGSKTEAHVIVCEIHASNGTMGRGECVPYKRYDETTDSVGRQIESVRSKVEYGLTRAELQDLLPAGAARNAIDCALWDLELKQGSISPLSSTLDLTAYTLGLDTPEKMAQAAAEAAHRPLLKIKLGQEGDKERLKAIRHAAPKARLIVDANEGWSAENVRQNIKACEEAGVELIEQPLPADHDEVLRQIQTTIALCADESLHTRRDLAGLKGKYSAINIKLDKAGGLTEAFALAQDAQAKGFKIMVGCMVGTSLAMAPAMMLQPYATWLDLDGPLLLSLDRAPGLKFEGSVIHPPTRALWGD
jgi:L-Ala-D/L-Glu epimerase